MKNVSWSQSVTVCQTPKSAETLLSPVGNLERDNGFSGYPDYHTEHPSSFRNRWIDYLGGIPCWFGLYWWSEDTKDKTVKALSRWFLRNARHFTCPVVARDLVQRFGIYKRHPWLVESQLNKLVTVWNGYYGLCLTQGRTPRCLKSQLEQAIYQALWPQNRDSYV